jgi:hypothetical protein
VVSVSKERANAIHEGMIFSFDLVALNAGCIIIGSYIDKSYNHQIIEKHCPYAKLFIEIYRSFIEIYRS